MSLTLKLLTITSLLIGSLFAQNNLSTEQKVLNYEKYRISQNQRYELKDASIYFKQALPLKGWTAFVIDVKLNINGKEVNVKDYLFSDGIAVTADLKMLDNGRSYKSLVSPTMPDSYYNDEHFIAGNKNARNKLVVFSDPLCPFCMDFVPDVIKHVNKNSQNIALYYYHFPLLRIHPAADTITKAMAVAHTNGYKDLVNKVYKADFDEYFQANETDAKKILDAFNKELGTKITMAQINDPKIIAEVKADEKAGDRMLVQGTPAIFVNGKVDTSRSQYLKLK
jgi:thiol:disulfide interchange protein DsbC